VTTSPAFLQEVAAQAALARAELDAATLTGDESAVQAATARLLDLDDIAARTIDNRLLELPSWP
jgi:hypothetical protein